MPSGIAVRASPKLWIRSARSATEPECAKIASCAAAATPRMTRLIALPLLLRATGRLSGLRGRASGRARRADGRGRACDRVRASGRGRVGDRDDGLDVTGAAARDVDADGRTGEGGRIRRVGEACPCRSTGVAANNPPDATTSTRDGHAEDGDGVRGDARPAGVAADGGCWGVLGVLRDDLSHPACCDLLHA